MERSKTHRGFGMYEFEDYYGETCTLQKSSIVEPECIWLGVNDVSPRILASKVMEGGTGWVDYPIHPDVMINSRMHLTRDHVRDLIPILQKFVDTGEL